MSNNQRKDTDLFYNFSEFAIFKARNGQRVRLIHYYEGQGGCYLAHSEDGHYWNLDKNLQCPDCRDYDIIGIHPLSAINAVSMEEITELIVNYAAVASPQKREQIRAMLMQHASEYQKKPWFP